MKVSNKSESLEWDFDESESFQKNDEETSLSPSRYTTKFSSKEEGMKQQVDSNDEAG